MKRKKALAIRWLFIVVAFLIVLIIALIITGVIKTNAFKIWEKIELMLGIR